MAQVEPIEAQSAEEDTHQERAGLLVATGPVAFDVAKESSRAQTQPSMIGDGTVGLVPIRVLVPTAGEIRRAGQFVQRGLVTVSTYVQALERRNRFLVSAQTRAVEHAARAWQLLAIVAVGCQCAVK